MCLDVFIWVKKMKYPLNISKEDSTYILLEKIFNIIGSQKVKNYMASKPWEISQKFIEFCG